MIGSACLASASSTGDKAGKLTVMPEPATTPSASATCSGVISAMGGAAGAVIREGRVVGVREQGDADGAAEVAFALGEVGGCPGRLAKDDGLGQGLGGRVVAREERDGGQPGLGREVGRESRLDDVADGFGAHKV